MSDLDKVKVLISRGDKEKAIGLLASILIKNRDEVEAWQLLGEMIDNPSRKKDCYNQVLRLSPHNLHALTRLQELEEPPLSEPQITSSKDVQNQEVNKGSLTKVGQTSNYVPNQNSYPPAKNSSDVLEIVIFIIGGIAAFFMILYVIGRTSYSSSDSNILCVGLILLGLIAGIVVLSLGNKNRS